MTDETTKPIGPRNPATPIADGDEAQFRGMVDAIPNLAWIADRTGWIFWYNRRWFDYTGTTLQEMQGWGWRKVHHPDHVERVVARISASFASGEPWEDTFPLRRHDGAYRWFLSRAQPVRNAEGQVVRWFGTNTDITEQRKAEAERAEAEERFRASDERQRLALEAGEFATWDMDVKTGRGLWSTNHYGLLGYPPGPAETDIRSLWVARVHPDDRDAVHRVIAEARASGQRYNFEHRICRADDGRVRWVRANGQFHYDPRGRAVRFVGVVRDITERKTAEIQLRTSNRRLTLLARLANGLIAVDALDRHLEASFEAVADEVGADIYFGYRLDPSAPGTLCLLASRGLDEAQTRAFGQVTFGRCPCGEVARLGAPLILADVDRRGDALTADLRALGGRAYAGFPIRAHGRLYGTMAFAARGRARFDDAEIGLMQTVADQFAVAMERDRLLHRLRESEASYRSALMAGRMGSWETDLISGVRTWTEAGMALFGLALPEGRGRLGGEADEYRAALHPEDRHLVDGFYELASKQDSFPAEYRIVRPDGTVLWLSGRGQVMDREADGRPRRLVSIMADVSERKATEERIQFLLREISHRSKNLLSVVQAVAAYTARNATSMADFQRRFLERLRGLAASQDLLVNENWQGAALGELARRQLAPFADPASGRLEVAGPDTVLNAEAAQALGLALHELATNATKYGALSAPGGRVAISWSVLAGEDGRSGLRLRWVEHGGPPVRIPEKKGFGCIVVERMVAQSLGGAVEMRFAPEGLNWAIDIPPANIVQPVRADDSAAASGVLLF